MTPLRAAGIGLLFGCLYVLLSLAGCASYADSFRTPPKEPERAPPRQIVIGRLQLSRITAVIFEADVPEGLPICFAYRQSPTEATCLSAAAWRRIILGTDRRAEPD